MKEDETMNKSLQNTEHNQPRKTHTKILIVILDDL